MTNVVFKVLPLTLVLAATSASAANITGASELPPGVAKLYEHACAVDDWIGGKRNLDGSSNSTFADGTRVYLLVCGDAASVLPFEVIVTSPSGRASEAVFHWRIKGKDIGDAGISNAHFGAAPGTVMSSSHASASCEPAYVHHWSGAAFELVHLNRSGCRKDE